MHLRRILYRDIYSVRYQGFYNMRKSYYCIFCHKYKPHGTEFYQNKKLGLCADCFSKLKLFPPSPLPCRTQTLGTVVSVTTYTASLRNALREYKFYNNPGYADIFAHICIRYMEQMDINNFMPFVRSHDMIVPVPLSKERIRERGYNQSELIAKIISGHFDIPCRCDALYKIKNNDCQSLTPHNKRSLNVRGVYKADADVVFGKRILLLDDIFTTGSTATECVKTLKAAGAYATSVFTLTNSQKYFYQNDYYKILKSVYKS